MNVSSDTRRQVMAAIVTVMAEADAAGDNAFDAARRAFPGTPDTVLCEAMAEVMEQEADAWWCQIERTIDVEVIRSAIAGSAEPVPAGAREAELDEAFEALTIEHTRGGPTACLG